MADAPVEAVVDLEQVADDATVAAPLKSAVAIPPVEIPGVADVSLVASTITDLEARED